MHQEAWSSSGSAPHSGQGSTRISVLRLRARASSKRRCRPFFTSPRFRFGLRDWSILPPPLLSLATVHVMAEGFDVAAMIARFQERARAVRDRPLPPLEGTARREYMQRAQIDYQDFAMLGDAEGFLEDGILVLRVDLRPPEGQGGS